MAEIEAIAKLVNQLSKLPGVGRKTAQRLAYHIIGLPEEQVPELAYALSILNFYVETGCFAINKPTDMVVFRSTRTFPGDTPEETLLRDCVLLAEEAHDIAERYCQPVFGLADGTMTLGEFMQVLQPNE